MEDWMGYCQGDLDNMTLINVAEDQIDDEWKTENPFVIQSDNIFEITKNLECPRCGYQRCSILKEDPELVKKRGRIIGYVEYDPIKDEFGDCYDVDEDGNVQKRE